MDADPIRVVIVDDQAMVRSGLRLILESEADIVVVGEAGDGRDALEVVASSRPDVVLIDIQMPVMDGVEATRRLMDQGADDRVAHSANSPGEARPRVLILTTFDLDEYVVAALRAGATGFLLKNAPADELIRAIRTTAAGEPSLASPVTRRMIEQYVRRRSVGGDAQRLARLSPREREVLGLIAEGLTNPEIADRLVIGEATVKTHVGSILSKLGLRDRIAAVIAAYELGIAGSGGGSGDPGRPPTVT